jgi:hypothetical protein
MNTFITVLNCLKMLAELLQKIAAKIPGIEVQSESSKETWSVSSGKNGAAIKTEMRHSKTNFKFHIGFVMRKDEDKARLFLSLNEAGMLMCHVYFKDLPFCAAPEPGNDEAEAWFVVDEPYNTEFLSENTPETRKEELLTLILTGAGKALNQEE